MSQTELQVIGEVLENQKLREFIENNLKESLNSIGFSEIFIKDLMEFFSDLQVDRFIGQYENELERVHSKGFFQKIVPDYFSKYVIPAIPASQKIIDVGCGTGVLANLLSKREDFKKIIGIDLNPYPEWDIFKTDKIEFKIIKENEFIDFMADEKPNTVVLTWTLHHMEYHEQERYLKYIYDNLKTKSEVVILEDAYSAKLRPESGITRHSSFMKFEKGDRQKIMAFYDWVANRILARRKLVNMSFAYRTIEEWEEIFEKTGFKNERQKYIGFPDQRDINTPQSLLIISKK